VFVGLFFIILVVSSYILSDSEERIQAETTARALRITKSKSYWNHLPGFLNNYIFSKIMIDKILSSGTLLAYANN